MIIQNISSHGQLTQDQYGITSVLELRGKEKFNRPNRPDIFDAVPRSIYLSCFYPTNVTENDPKTQRPSGLPEDLAKMWDREYKGFEFDGNDLWVKKYGYIRANFTVSYATLMYPLTSHVSLNAPLIIYYTI